MQYVIVGNGVAGTTAAEHIRKVDSTGRITIITNEAYPFYNRMRLIDFLTGSIDEKDLVLKKDEWYKEREIDLILNRNISEVDRGKRELIADDGLRTAYDRLLLATGGLSFVPPIPGADKKGVFTLRTLKDGKAINAHVAEGNKRAILVGGGVLGLEAGNSLKKAGCMITVVEVFPRLLPRQMDPNGAEILKTQMENLGFSFYMGLTVKEIFGKERAEGIVLNNGTRVEGDTILISAGVRPNTSLAEKMGLTVAKGIVVDDTMQTELSDIYAAGDLIQHRDVYYGIWPASSKQGEIAGTNMAGGERVYEGSMMTNTLKVAGIDLAAAGDIDAEGNFESIVKQNPENFIYKKIVIKDDHIIGMILYGDLKDFSVIKGAMENNRDIRDVRQELERWNMEVLQDGLRDDRNRQ